MLTIGKPYVKRFDDKSRLISDITVDGKVNKIFVEVDNIYDDQDYDEWARHIRSQFIGDK